MAAIVIADIEWLRAKLYFLGFFSSIIFLLRFMSQWLSSEKRGYSYAGKSFWLYSIVGNCLLLSHSLIQVQLSVALIQASQMVLACRNLDLMRAHPRLSQQRTIVLLFLSLVCVVLLFVLQSMLLYGHFDWVRTPRMPWMKHPAERLSPLWHLFGFLSLLAFSSRFFFQWLAAEKHQCSQLTGQFWWISIVGSVSSLCYFCRMGDLVNILGQSASLIPAIRNLQLIARAKP